MQFDPFMDRFSRIVRNDLGAAIGEVLAKHDTAPAKKIADTYFRTGIEPCYREYIQERLTKYSRVVKQLDAVPAGTLWQSLVLWDHQLFYEVHEVLEHAWTRASGTEKEVLQAMIRAAGVYIKLEYGYADAARKIAQKAIPVLLANRGFLASYFDPAKLVDALQECALPPPRLLRMQSGFAG